MSDPIRYLLAFLVPLVGALVLTPLAGRLAHRMGAVDLPGGRKAHTQVTPTLGGLAMMGALVLVGAVVAGTNGQLLVILACSIVMVAVGFRDDIASVSPWVRLGVEAAAGVSLWLVGIRAGIFSVPALDLLVTVLWVVALVNAYNMTDNMDGLAGGAAFASALGVAAITAAQGDYLVTSFAFAVAGSSLGFLRYNFPPAKIFMGDAGSMLLGFLVAALGLHLDLAVTHSLTRLVVIGLLAAGPMFDLTLVMVARIAGRRAVFSAGTDHTSHRLAHRGHSRRGLALLLPGAQLVASSLAFVIYRVDAPAPTVWALAGGVALWLGLLWTFLRMPHPVALEIGADETVALPDVDLEVGRSS